MTYNFRSSLQAAATWPDERFAALLLAGDALAAKLDGTGRQEVIAAALACGRAVAAGLSREYGAAKPRAIAAALGIAISDADLPGARVTLSVYEPERKRIRLNGDVLASIERTIAGQNLAAVLGPVDVAETVIAHELFHHAEAGDRSLYSRRKVITLWRFGPIRYRSTLPAAGEIAAMACAKALCRLTINPVLLEAVLIAATDADQAAAWLARLENMA